MKKGFWNRVKRVVAGVMVAAMLFTTGHGVGSEPGISTYGEIVAESWKRN